MTFVVFYILEEYFSDHDTFSVTFLGLGFPLEW